MPERHVDVMIAGAGIAGLLLARALQARGRSVAVIHAPGLPGAGEASVGLLNPVRGQRYTLAWRAREVFAAAAETYRAVESAAGEHFFRELPILRAFSRPEDRSTWMKRAAAISEAGFRHEEIAAAPRGLRSPPHGAVRIDGGGVVAPRAVLSFLRGEMRKQGLLIEAPFDLASCATDRAGVRWPGGGMAASTLVLAGGAADIGHPLMRGLGLRPVKGESLLIRAPGLDPSASFVCGHHLVPVGGDLWVCGGTKRPDDATNEPSAEGRDELCSFLLCQLGVEFEVVGHWCGVRAVSPDTRPVAGPLNQDGTIHVLNGLGSQGFSVAPWLAERMSDALCGVAALPDEVLPDRKVLMKRTSCDTTRGATELMRAFAIEHAISGDGAVDLTVGNGGDTMWLAGLVGPAGYVIGIDVQPVAIERTRRRIEDHAIVARVELRCGNHADLEALLPVDLHHRVGVVVAALGRLPGSRSPVATQAGTTLKALTAGLNHLRSGGVLVVSFDVRRPEGREELEIISQWSRVLDVRRYRTRWMETSPTRGKHGPVFTLVRVSA